jgi:mannosyltransferase OCH1-like enzyme
MDWNKERIYDFVKLNYPEFLSSYEAYDVLIKQHDAAIYLIVNHFGGVFIQHSIKLQKNIEPLLKGAEAVFSLQTIDYKGFANSFFATVKAHPVWENIINECLLKKPSKFLTLAFGEKFIFVELSKYQQNNKEDIKILAYQHLFPFDWIDAKENFLIKEECINDDSECFDLFPDAYGFCDWSGSWKNHYVCEEL